MIPFPVEFKSGIPPQHQVVYAAKKALVSGVLRPGDPFPSVRALSQALRINPNTAQKVIGRLKQEGILEVRPGIGTVIADAIVPSEADRSALLEAVEEVVVQARCLGLDLDQIHAAIDQHWSRLSPDPSDRRER